MFCKMVPLPRKKRSGSVPVYLNVYDLTTINGYAYWLGLGVYHSGVQVHGVEYGFGAHEHGTTGIFEVEPKQCPGFTYRKSILVGRTDLGPKEVAALMEKLAQDYSGNKYHLITNNCNHFCNDVCLSLTRRPIPRWVNRLARLGFMCNCVLPAGLNGTKVKSRSVVYEEKRRLRSNSTGNAMFVPSNAPPLTRSANSSGRQRRCLPPPLYLIHSSSTSRVTLEL